MYFRQCNQIYNYEPLKETSLGNNTSRPVAKGCTMKYLIYLQWYTAGFFIQALWNVRFFLLQRHCFRGCFLYFIRTLPVYAGLRTWRHKCWAMGSLPRPRVLNAPELTSRCHPRRPTGRAKALIPKCATWGGTKSPRCYGFLGYSGSYLPFPYSAIQVLYLN